MDSVQESIASTMALTQDSASIDLIFLYECLQHYDAATFPFLFSPLTLPFIHCRIQ